MEISTFVTTLIKKQILIFKVCFDEKRKLSGMISQKKIQQLIVIIEEVCDTQVHRTDNQQNLVYKHILVETIKKKITFEATSILISKHLTKYVKLAYGSAFVDVVTKQKVPRIHTNTFWGLSGINQYRRLLFEYRLKKSYYKKSRIEAFKEQQSRLKIEGEVGDEDGQNEEILSPAIDEDEQSQVQSEEMQWFQNKFKEIEQKYQQSEVQCQRLRKKNQQLQEKNLRLQEEISACKNKLKIIKNLCDVQKE